ncbi:hypothetical protein EVAR_40560_1 [Eumeta japonica]|uniref:RNA-directed DNA polymerase from mobile element jockey n=1 Tax=Eumeta variegata TaxID=151549 RepID=A0A4C1VX01_EUMVA|nr:hypothetical protein EVAR_40560_1 [Eumeta japonica]
MTPKHCSKVGLHNPGSLAKNHDELILAVTQHSLDILAINESWLLSKEEERASSLPGFTLRPPKGCGGRGGRTAFYVRRGIRIRICERPVFVPVEQI